MGSLKEESKAFESKGTLTIADLDQVDVNLNLFDGDGINSNDGKPFKYKYIEVNSLEYRVPDSVRQQIKEILSAKADLKFVKVKKSGSGFMTKYQVIAL